MPSHFLLHSNQSWQALVEAFFSITTVDPTPLLLEGLSLHLNSPFVENFHEVTHGLYDFVIRCYGACGKTFVVD
jgi:hypothetical protein